MTKIYLLFLMFALSPIWLIAGDKANKALVENNNFLEISKNYLEIHKVHNMINASQRLLDNLEMINFALKPLNKAIKPIDILKIHYAYPLKIYLPKNAVITKAVFSNSATQPIVSQNMIYLSVDKKFLSGLLDIFYFYSPEKKNGKNFSIKIDKYNVEKNKIDNKMLYTQINYHEAKKISFQKILTFLKPYEYSMKYSEVEYDGIVYHIYLVNIVESNKILKQYRDNKYINSSIEFGNREYNYYVK